MPSPTPGAQTVELARLAEITGPNDQTGDSIPVHFNPSSLQLQLSNELKDTKNNERKQYVAKTSAKLTMDLLFDTTHNGEDATRTTGKLQAFLAPPLPEGDRARQQVPPPLVLFEWGTLRFKGIVESYKETIDFFSPDGVPLRSTVNLTLSRQDQVFDEAGGDAPPNAGSVDDDLFEAGAGSASDLANQAQDPGAARALGAANGQENLRFGDGSTLTAGGQVALKPPAAFAGLGASADLGLGGELDLGGGLDLSAGAALGASAGGAFGASAGAGFGISGGAGIGVSGGAGLEVSAGAGIAGLSQLSATEGAFAGLRTSVTPPTRARVDIRKLMPAAAAAGLATESGAMFQVGGRASIEGPAGLSANVGASAKLSFDGD